MTRQDSTAKYSWRWPSSSRSRSSKDGVGGLEGVAAGLHGLHSLGDPGDGLLVAGQVVAELAALQLDRGAAGHVRDQHPHVVADQGGVDVLVEHRVDLDRGGVQPGLVRERAQPDVGLVGVRRDVGDLADRVRDPGHFLEAWFRQHLAALLELEAGHHAEQVGVAGPLAVAVRGALHVGDARVHRDQRVGHPAGGVVVAVDAQASLRGLFYGGDCVAELVWEHAAVGVAQGDDVRARGGGGFQYFERVVRVGPVAVEEVLGVQEHPLAVLAQVGDRVGDHGEVLFEGGPQG